MLVKNRNFGQKTLLSRIGIGLNFGQKSNFGQKLKCWSKIEILVNNQNFKINQIKNTKIFKKKNTKIFKKIQKVAAYSFQKRFGFKFFGFFFKFFGFFRSPFSN